MKNIIIQILIFVFMFAFTSIYSQEVTVTDAGSFSGSINGKDFKNMIRYGESEDRVTIATGDESFTLTINCDGISSISQLKTGTYDLSSDKNINVLFLNNNAGMPSIVTEGKLIITKNDSNVIGGTLEFIASAGGIPVEMGGVQTKLTGGTFEIDRNK